MKKRIKDYDLARVLAICFMILVHLMYAIFDYSNEVTFKVIDFLGSPFAAPVFMFILGANIVSSKKRCRSLFKRGLYIFIASIVFNIICHALPFFIMDSINGNTIYGLESVHWIFAVDILTFAGMAFMLMALLKKLKVNNIELAIIAVSLSIINMVLTRFIPVDFDNNILLASVTSLFYSSSITGYFSLFGWFIFPVAGKIYMDLRNKYEDSNHFHIVSLVIGLVGFIIMLLFQNTAYNGGPIINFYDEYTYYRMPLYGSIMAILFIMLWLNIVYYFSKMFNDKHMNFIVKISKNLTNIYFVQWFLINYVFVLAFNNQFRVGTLGLMICFGILLVITNLLAVCYKQLKVYLDM